MLSILPYHLAITRYFQEQEPVWRFFAHHTHKAEQLQQFKTDLLKNTYKFDETAHATLYEQVNIAKQKLNLSIPVTLYQVQHVEDSNASIVYLNQEAHIVFSGPLLQLLSPGETLAVIAHELSHVQLYSQLNGEVEIADRIITAIVNNLHSSTAHYETARLFHLYTEIFCDRGAYLVTGDYTPVIGSLVKTATGLPSVDADSYLRQAEEIFSSDRDTRTNAVSHPENFIRARAIWLWHKEAAGAEPVIQEMIEGLTALDDLDLIRQREVSDITRELISRLLTPDWMQTTLNESLAHQYFEKFTNTTSASIDALATRIARLHSSVQNYLAYVLYDFATADKELADLPMGYCFSLAGTLNLEQAFVKALQQERKLTEKKLAAFKKEALEDFQQQQSSTV